MRDLVECFLHGRFSIFIKKLKSAEGQSYDPLVCIAFFGIGVVVAFHMRTTFRKLDLAAWFQMPVALDLLMSDALSKCDRASRTYNSALETLANPSNCQRDPGRG